MLNVSRSYAAVYTVNTAGNTMKLLDSETELGELYCVNRELKTVNNSEGTDAYVNKAVLLASNSNTLHTERKEAVIFNKNTT